MRYLLVSVMALLVAASAAANGYEDASAPSSPSPPGPPGPVWGGPDALVLWDNGPLVTGDCPNNNPPGAESRAERGTAGWGHQLVNGWRVADDFTVPAGEEWTVQAITFFAYQVDAGPGPSTVNHVNLRIWDGQPDDPASNVICGDTSTDLLLSSAWATIYRTLSSAPCLDNRAVMADIIELPADCPDCTGFPGTLRLAAGTYWFDWQSDGNPDYTGPWVPPITPPGAGQPPNNTMNALQFYEGEWHPPGDPEDFPFIIEGDFCAVTPVEASTWGRIKAQYK